MADIPTYTLNDGTTLPAIGFGTVSLKGEDGIEDRRCGWHSRPATGCSTRR